MVEPFSRRQLQDDDSRIAGFPIGEYVTREKTEKYREAISIQAEVPPTPSEHDSQGIAVIGTTVPAPEDPGSSLDFIPHVARARSFRIIVHEDAGEVVDPFGSDSIAEQTIDLPPIYATLGDRIYNSSSNSLLPTSSTG